MIIVTAGVLYAVLPVSEAGRPGQQPWTEQLNRPYPHAGPVLTLAALVPMYMAIAAWTPGRALFVPELALDRAVPLQPAWALVYASQWVFSFLPVFIVRGAPLRRRVVLAYLTIVSVAYAGFLLYPTVAPRPSHVMGDGFFAWSLRGVYAIDPPYNCFPSLHVAYSCLAALVAYHVHRGVGRAALLWAAVISVSTLFTKQHYVVDVVAGVAIAYAAYAAFVRRAPHVWLSQEDQRLAPRRALVVPGIFGALVACAWAAYLTR
jgi:membrane-associated phospholipid phosphatase